MLVVDSIRQVNGNIAEKMSASFRHLGVTRARRCVRYPVYDKMNSSSSEEAHHALQWPNLAGMSVYRHIHL
jgi:hypothetical protein